MQEGDDDILELHYAPDPALEVEVEADNTWRIDDAPVDPGPRPVLKRGPPQEEVFPKPRSATKIRLKNSPERWSPPREQLPEIPEGDGFAGLFTATNAPGSKRCLCHAARYQDQELQGLQPAVRKHSDPHPPAVA